MPAYQYKFENRVRHSPRPQREIDLFNEFVSKVVNAYDLVKRLNPPKEKVIAAVIEQYRVGAFKVTGWKGRPLKPEAETLRKKDYEAGYTDRELKERWNVAITCVQGWRYRRGLKPNKRKRG